MWATPEEIAFSICTHENYIIESIKNISKNKSPIETYCHLNECLYKTDVSKDNKFQKDYIRFYVLFRCPKEFLKIYFNFMEENKYNPNYNFKAISNYLYVASGKIKSKEGKLLKPINYFSFITKMLNLIYDEFPIYDTNVGRVFRYENNMKTNIEFIEYMIKSYNTIQEKNLIDSSIKKFDCEFKEYPLSFTKKIDFMIWRLGN